MRRVTAASYASLKGPRGQLGYWKDRSIRLHEWQHANSVFPSFDLDIRGNTVGPADHLVTGPPACWITQPLASSAASLLDHQLSKRRAFVYCLTPNFCLKQGFKEPAKRNTGRAFLRREPRPEGVVAQAAAGHRRPVSIHLSGPQVPCRGESSLFWLLLHFFCGSGAVQRHGLPTNCFLVPHAHNLLRRPCCDMRVICTSRHCQQRRR